MTGSPFLGPLALMGYALAVVVLGYLVVHFSGLNARLRSCLKYIPGVSTSSLPAPASSSTTTLASSLARNAKAAATSTLKVAPPHLPKDQLHLWSYITSFLKRRWRNRIMLEELPTTAPSDDDAAPLPAAPKAKAKPHPAPVLVDLSEPRTSTVSSPSIPMRVLGTATPLLSPPFLRSPTALLAGASSVLATPPRLPSSEYTSTSTVRSPPLLPSTPPPHRSTAHHIEPVSLSPFSSPPSKTSSKAHQDLVGAYELNNTYPVMQMHRSSPNVIYPPARPRTPSPITHNPYFLATSPVAHRRTRSLGGINAKRVLTPAIAVSLMNEGRKAGEGDYSLETGGLKPPYRPLASRSTEVLIDLEGGDGQCIEDYPSEVQVNLHSSQPEQESSFSSGLPSTLTVERAPHLENNRHELECDATTAPVEPAEPPKSVTNNAWRQWATEDHPFSATHDDDDDIFTDGDAAVEALAVPFPSYDSPFDDGASAPRRQCSPFDDPFNDPISPSSAALASPSPSPSPPPNCSSEEGQSPSEPWELVDEADSAEQIVVPDDEEEAKEREPPSSFVSSQMPTPPASPPFALLRMPSASSKGLLRLEEGLVEGEVVGDDVDDLEAGLVDEFVEEQDEGSREVEEEECSEEAAEEIVEEEGGEGPRDAEEENCSREAVEEFVEEGGPEDLGADSELFGGEEEKSDEGLKVVEPTDLEEEQVDAEGLHFDDPSVPDLPSLLIEVSAVASTDMSKEVARVSPEPSDDAVVDVGKDENVDGSSDSELLDHDDPPLPTIPESPLADKPRPAWSLRATEAPRLGLVEVTIETAKPNDVNTSDVLPPTNAELVPGAFPGSSSLTQTNPDSSPSTTPPQSKTQTSSPLVTPQAPSTMRQRRISSIDTSSFAAAVVSLRRKPEPLDIALAMQMRPGLGAGADPAWMVRFMMSVFGWLAVAVSAGID
ncbi:hypothetical protein D9611_009349 [Ephemerocybe angulata]|uniref:Uncharacterized protein n=1 Tax=Ephemerocybe angulata TaxID=980116 RepID=A0A8H5BGY5_9AGAR|nr:hypothetical protein D9611_009349 [Tulosesus angulatus]